MKQIKKVYNRISEAVSMKNMSWIALIVFILSLIPICYLSFVNRASGDDYGYGIYTRAAWMASHSLIEVVKAIGRTIKQYYYGWQGTWFSIAVFALQPEVFSDKAYVIVVFLMLLLWIGSTALLFHQILRKEWGFDRWNYLLITIVYMVISIQFVPSTKSFIFWFNGCAHYLLPFAMCQLVVWLLLKYMEEYGAKYLVWITILVTLLGGSNYQAALFALIVLFYAGVAGWVQKKDKKVVFLIVPIVLEAVGLIISMKAPGNKVRGGEDFGFSISKAVYTIGMCFLEGVRDVVGYFQEKPIIFVGLFVLFLFLLEAFGERQKKRGKIPSLIISLALFCLYCAMQAPALYADVEVSRGVLNMNYVTFLLTATGILAVIAEMLINRIAGKCIDTRKVLEKEIHKKLVLPGLLVCMGLVILCRSNLKISTMWVSMEYIKSGQAADYKQQMDMQTELLTDEENQDVVLPFVNDVQGPLMQMPVTADPQAWTNTVTRDFYGKNSVVAIPRDEWLTIYGKGK